MCKCACVLCTSVSVSVFMSVYVCALFMCMCIVCNVEKASVFVYSHLFCVRAVVARALKSHPILSEKLPFSQHPQPQSSSLCIPFFHANEMSNTNLLFFAFFFFFFFSFLPIHSVFYRNRKKTFLLSFVSVSLKITCSAKMSANCKNSKFCLTLKQDYCYFYSNANQPNTAIMRLVDAKFITVWSLWFFFSQLFSLNSNHSLHISLIHQQLK